MRKTIGISCNRLGHSGGFERYARDLIRGFSDRGYRIKLFAKEFDTSVPEFALVDPIRLSVTGIPGKLRDQLFSWRLNRNRERQSVDLLIACNRVTNADIAVCGGTHLGFLAATSKRENLGDRLQLKLERSHYSSSKKIVAHSLMMLMELRNLYDLPSNKIELIYPPIDTNAFKRPNQEFREQLRAKLGLSPHECVFFFASTSHVRKGYPLLQKYFSQSSLPVRLVVAGRPVESSGKIHYAGYVKDMAAWYGAADYTIVASQYEPFGLVAAESVLCGTPACLSNAVGAAEVIAPHAKLVFNAREDDLTQTIEEAYRNRVIMRHALATQGAFVPEYYPSIDAHISALLRDAS
jgi:glycosyltransferase involved in cell wall biosynthesis